MSVVTIAGLCLVATIVCKIIEKDHKDYAMMISIGLVSFVLIIIVSSITPILDEVEKLFNLSGVPQNYVKIMFKALGICYISQLASECCKDCGENAVASEVELAGKIALMLISLPLFSGITEIVRELIYF